MITVPFVGGESRKFTTYADGRPNFDVIDQFNAATGQYEVRVMCPEGYWHVYSTIQNNKV